MGKIRERACLYYLNEGNCKKGHKGTFNKCCQICKDYRVKPGSQPRQKDLRKEKNMKWEKKQKNLFF